MVQVDADKATGELVAVNTTNVDFAASPYYGLWFPCSGSVFPYGDTHLGSEEFEPDCRYGLDTNGGDRSSTRGAFGIAQQAAQWSYYQDASPTVNGVNYSPGLTLASPPVAGVIDVIVNSPSSSPPTLVWPPGAQEKFVCYAYGWTPEVSPSPKLAALGGPASKNTKWYTLGRFSHEVSVLMWDGKTVLMGDDKTAGVLGMFVADVKGKEGRGGEGRDEGEGGGEDLDKKTTPAPCFRRPLLRHHLRRRPVQPGGRRRQRPRHRVGRVLGAAGARQAGQAQVARHQHPVLRHV